MENIETPSKMQSKATISIGDPPAESYEYFKKYCIYHGMSTCDSGPMNTAKLSNNKNYYTGDEVQIRYLHALNLGLLRSATRGRTVEEIMRHHKKRRSQCCWDNVSPLSKLSYMI
jgi:hypothetical protein